MIITARVLGEIATISRNFEWKCENKNLEDILNHTKDENLRSPSNPFPEYLEAKRVVAKFKNSKIIDMKKEDWDIHNPRQKGVIY